MNYRYTPIQIFWFSLIVWIVFAYLTIVLNPLAIFHVLNPVSIALGTILIIVYSEGIIDAWKYRKEGITLPHLLTFGVVLNWLGMCIRMARWYLTGQHPAVIHNVDFWFYNFGLWISIWAALFLLGASGIAVKGGYRATTLMVLFLIIIAALAFTDFSTQHYYEMIEHQRLFSR